MLLAAAITLSGVQIPAFGGQGKVSVIVAEAASTTGCVPMWAYMKNGSGRLTTYTTNALNRSTGYIEPGDYCKILAFYSNGAVKVSYPTPSGYRTAYASMSGFMVSTNFSNNTKTLGTRLTAYRRSTGNSTIGTVFATDKVMVIGNANGRTQVVYPCAGGYKLGWVAGNYSANGGSNPQGYVDGVASGSTGKITVTGWAFDRDSLGSNLQIHVYVGGPAGSGAPGYAITANAYRPDVNRVFSGVGNYHGYNATFSVSRTGVQTVYIYAINVGGGNANPLLGTKTVNIQGANNGADISFDSLIARYPSYSKWNSSYKNIAWQCHGFALTLGDALTGTNPNNWKRVYNLNSLKRGDIIRCSRPHTIMVTGVSGNTITYVDCNWVAKNTVKWNQNIQRSQITSRFGKLSYVLVCPK